jgi:AcrR family transcriptional regulator
VDNRREQLLAAAAKVIQERGFADTRLSDVAREAGISPALVVYYFETRERLMVEALRYSEETFAEAVAARLEELGTARERLHELIQLTCTDRPTPQMPSGWGLWFDLWAQAARHPDAARYRADFDARWRERVADTVRQGVAEGDFVATDPDRFAQLLTALLDGLAVQVALADETVTPEVACDLADELCRLMLGTGAGPLPNPE